MRVNAARQGLQPPHLCHMLSRQFCSLDRLDTSHSKEKANLQVTTDGHNGERPYSKCVPRLLSQIIFIPQLTDVITITQSDCTICDGTCKSQGMPADQILYNGFL